ncbi:hypothetical protein V8E36_002673 [Tilletia maclaganii]
MPNATGLDPSSSHHQQPSSPTSSFKCREGVRLNQKGANSPFPSLTPPPLSILHPLTNTFLDLTVPNTTVTPGKPLFITLPEKGAFRVTAHSDGKSEIITAALGSVKLNATVHSKFLGNIPASISCPALARPVVIGFIRAEPGYTAVKVPTKVYDLVDTPLGSLLGTAGITFDCTAGSLGSFKLPTYVSGYIGNLTVNAGNPFQFENGHATVKIPQSVQTAAKGLYPDADGFSIKLSSLRFSAQGASPEINDVAKTSSITTDTYKFKTSGSVAVDVPGKTGLLAPVQFTANQDAAGSLAYTYLDSTAGTFIIKQGTKTLKSISFKCPQPTPRLGLFSVNVFALPSLHEQPAGTGRIIPSTGLFDILMSNE